MSESWSSLEYAHAGRVMLASLQDAPGKVWFAFYRYTEPAIFTHLIVAGVDLDRAVRVLHTAAAALRLARDFALVVPFRVGDGIIARELGLSSGAVVADLIDAADTACETARFYEESDRNFAESRGWEEAWLDRILARDTPLDGGAW